MALTFQPLLFSGFTTSSSSGGGGGSGTVTSVGLSLPTSVFTVTNSPVVTNGTLTGSFNTQSANTIFAGPTTGAAAVPTFRSLVAADIPTLNQNTTGTASNITAASNSTLTTLPNLSLPYSQVTGVPASTSFYKQNITLASQDITNQYVNLAYTVVPYSLTLAVDKAYQVEGDDYILSTVGGVTRLTFNNALATGGVSALVSGDILNLQYTH